jgi:tetratricopeptide (TPR) repeat protein
MYAVSASSDITAIETKSEEKAFTGSNSGSVLIGLKSTYGMIPILACAALFSLYLLCFTAAYNGYQGLKQMDTENYKSAILYYEEAERLDPKNTDYLFELSKLYNYYAKISLSDRERLSWLKKAKITGENSINWNKNYPPQLQTLMQTYRNLNLPLQVLECSQKLIKYQQCDCLNYEFAAEGYITAAKYYEKNKNRDKARELLIKCINIKNNTYLSRSNTGMKYNMLKKEPESIKICIDHLSIYTDEAKELLKRIN